MNIKQYNQIVQIYVDLLSLKILILNTFSLSMAMENSETITSFFLSRLLFQTFKTGIIYQNNVITVDKIFSINITKSKHLMSY